MNLLVCRDLKVHLVYVRMSVVDKSNVSWRRGERVTTDIAMLPRDDVPETTMQAPFDQDSRPKSREQTDNGTCSDPWPIWKVRQKDGRKEPTSLLPVGRHQRITRRPDAWDSTDNPGLFHGWPQTGNEKSRIVRNPELTVASVL